MKKAIFNSVFNNLSESLNKKLNCTIILATASPIKEI